MRSLQETRLLARDPANMYFHIIFLIYSLTFVLFVLYQNEYIAKRIEEKYGISEIFVYRLAIGMGAVALINLLKIIIANGTTMKVLFAVISGVALVVMMLIGNMGEEDK